MNKWDMDIIINKHIKIRSLTHLLLHPIFMVL